MTGSLMDTPWLLTVAIVVLIVGRVLQVYKDWVDDGLTWLTYRYLVTHVVGYAMLAEVSRRIDAPVAVVVTLLTAGFYAWIMGSKITALARNKLARIVHESRRLNMRTPTTAREWLRANSFYFIVLAHCLAAKAHEKMKGF